MEASGCDYRTPAVHPRSPGSGQVTFTDLCVLYGISRVTGYKWRHRAQQSARDLLIRTPSLVAR